MFEKRAKSGTGCHSDGLIKWVETLGVLIRSNVLRETSKESALILATGVSYNMVLTKMQFDPLQLL